ncbi:enoyl-CoA hydratase, partial [Streptomyces sp. SID10244]|nr:enoyl-CoA hydratase [Streptomyces sp. SID10244]
MTDEAAPEVPETLPLLVERVDQVTVLTLNRPERRNAINRDMRRAMKKELWRADDDPDVHVVVITGS